MKVLKLCTGQKIYERFQPLELKKSKQRDEIFKPQPNVHTADKNYSKIAKNFKKSCIFLFCKNRRRNSQKLIQLILKLGT